MLIQTAHLELLEKVLCREFMKSLIYISATSCRSVLHFRKIQEHLHAFEASRRESLGS